LPVSHRRRPITKLRPGQRRRGVPLLRAGCPAHGRYGTLRFLARVHFGLLEAPAVVPQPVVDQVVAVAPAAISSAAWPWALTREDWQSCPICSAVHTRLGRDARPTASHWICKDRDCRVSSKIRAGRVLQAVTDWPTIYTGIFDEKGQRKTWRRLRDAIKRAGGEALGIPLDGGRVLAWPAQPTRG